MEELENHARVIPCCQHSETGAQVYVRYHPTDYNNHELQLEKFKKLNKKISTLYSIPQSELNKTLSLPQTATNALEWCCRPRRQNSEDLRLTGRQSEACSRRRLKSTAWFLSIDAP